MEFFGYSIDKKDNHTHDKKVFKNSIVDRDDINVTSPAGGSLSTRQIPTIHHFDDDTSKIHTYRKMALNNVHIQLAINEIKNEVFVFSDITKKAFSLSFFSDSDINKNTQKKIIEECDNLYEIIGFKDNALSWFDDWYVDSKFTLHVVVDEKKPNAGILDVVQLDPLKTRKVKVIPNSDVNGVIDINNVHEYYIYRNNFDNKNTSQTLYIDDFNDVKNDVLMSSDSVINITSGLRDKTTKTTIGHLDKAIIPHNNLRMLEESMLIFRVVRAPMRRAFYIDVSNLQPKKAEIYLEKLKNTFKVNVAFDRDTGTITNNRHTHSIMEDYYIPRQGSRTTEIETIEGQNTQDILEEVEYARDQLWLGLNVPRSRFTDDSSTMFSKPSEIQRDEHRMNLFVRRCRDQFMKFFDELLKRQLILKGVIKSHEWDGIKGKYTYNFAEDSLFTEYRKLEKLSSKLDILDDMRDAIADGYFSKQYVRENVLMQNEKQIEEIKKQREYETKNEDINDE